MATSGLIIRQNERHEISLPARVRVAYAHRDAVRFARGVTDDNGWMDVHLIDFSAAGAGFVTQVFLPRGVTFEIRIPDPHPDPDPGPGAGVDEPMFEGVVRVMRVQMMDRRPAYLIGSAFADHDDETIARVERLIARLSGGDAPDA